MKTAVGNEEVLTLVRKKTTVEITPTKQRKLLIDSYTQCISSSLKLDTIVEVL